MIFAKVFCFLFYGVCRVGIKENVTCCFIYYPLTHVKFKMRRLIISWKHYNIYVKNRVTLLFSGCLLQHLLLDKVGSQSQEQQNVAIKELNARLSYMVYCIFYLWYRNCLRRRLCKGKNVCRTVAPL